MTSELLADPLFRQRYGFSREGDVLRVEIWTTPGGVCSPSTSIRGSRALPGARRGGDLPPRSQAVARRCRRAAGGSGRRPPLLPNTGEGIAHLVVVAAPALKLRESIEAGVRLAQSGKLTATGKPRGLRGLIEAAALAHRDRETVILSSPPPVMQRLLFPRLARFATSAPVVEVEDDGQAER